MSHNNNQSIRDRLINNGIKLFQAKRKFQKFTQNPEADKLLNNLEEYPHAFLIACIMDRQVKAERAWLIPYRLYEKIGDFSMETLSKLSEAEILTLMTEPEPLHRFAALMSEQIYHALKRLNSQYRGDASLIWENNPSSSTVVYQFLEFDGVGPKIATMTANILARDFKVPFSDYYSIDISVDIHVRRVLGRLGLIPPKATVEQIIYRARSLNPEFPGLLDNPVWEIGRTCCKPTRPDCKNCYMMDLCPAIS